MQPDEMRNDYPRPAIRAADNLCAYLKLPLNDSAWKQIVIEVSHAMDTHPDKVRVDWLDANLGKVVPGSADAKYWILGQREFAPNKATTVRAAIDAARAG